MKLEGRGSITMGRNHPDGMTVPAAAVLALLALLVGAVQPLSGAPSAIAGEDRTDYTGRPVVFEGFGNPDPSLRIILYEWDFDGDGVYDWNSTRSGFTTHRFAQPGDYQAVLRVTQFNASNSQLLTATDTVNVNVISGRPVGKITSDANAKMGTKHLLRTNYYDPDGGQLSYVWRIDGVVTSDQPTLRHRFDKVRVYNVTVRVVDDEGEADTDQLLLSVVEELPDEDDNRVYWVLLIILILVVVAAVAYRAILRGHRRPERGDALSYDEAKAETPEIMTPATLSDRQAEPEARPRPRIVRPEQAARKGAKGPVRPRRARVPAAPARMPCPECGTTMSEEGTCPFCDANEAIDGVERRVRDMQEEGFILAEVEDRLEAAKSELHVKDFDGVKHALGEAEDLIAEAVRDHERCMDLMHLLDELLHEARDRDLDVTKASNLLKLSKSFMTSGKYPKAIHYAERSRDFLLEKLQPFDLDRYFCEHCRSEVDIEAERCPHCERTIESGLIKRARRELAELKRRFEGLAKDHSEREDIASQLEKAHGHVEGRSAAAANEHIHRARLMLEGASAEEPSEEDLRLEEDGEGPRPPGTPDQDAQEEPGTMEGMEGTSQEEAEGREEEGEGPGQDGPPEGQ